MVLPVVDIMRKRVATCTAEASVLAACKKLKAHKTSTVVIIDRQRRVLGVFSERDLVNKVIIKGLSPLKTKVRAVMSSPVVCGDVSQTDVQIANLIIREHVKKIPILKEGKLVGIVAESDLLRHLAESIFEG